MEDSSGLFSLLYGCNNLRGKILDVSCLLRTCSIFCSFISLLSSWFAKGFSCSFSSSSSNFGTFFFFFGVPRMESSSLSPDSSIIASPSATYARLAYLFLIFSFSALARLGSTNVFPSLNKDCAIPSSSGDSVAFYSSIASNFMGATFFKLAEADLFVYSTVF